MYDNNCILSDFFKYLLDNNTKSNTVFIIAEFWIFYQLMLKRSFSKSLILEFILSGGTMVKNLPAMQETQETQVWSLGQEDHLE